MRKLMELKNGTMAVTIALPGEGPANQRFDSSCWVVQVVLNGVHRFCQREQVLPGRVSLGGAGLCGEFALDGAAEEAAPGGRFPKPGVGLLTQVPGGGPFDIWKTYAVEPFPKTWKAEADRVVFVEEPAECLGWAARITRCLVLRRNELTLTTTVENVGKRPLDLSEYQHNFVALDDLPLGPGYRWDIPFDGTLAGAADCFRRMDPSGRAQEKAPAPVRIEGSAMLWDQAMDGRALHKATPGEEVGTVPEYAWSLSHRTNPASVTEICHFAPARLYCWAIEHCACVEAYWADRVEPGRKSAFARTWRFEDERTGR